MTSEQPFLQGDVPTLQKTDTINGACLSALRISHPPSLGAENIHHAHVVFMPRNRTGVECLLSAVSTPILSRHLGFPISNRLWRRFCNVFLDVAKSEYSGWVRSSRCFLSRLVRFLCRVVKAVDVLESIFVESHRRLSCFIIVSYVYAVVRKIAPNKIGFTLFIPPVIHIRWIFFDMEMFSVYFHNIVL